MAGASGKLGLKIADAGHTCGEERLETLTVCTKPQNCRHGAACQPGVLHSHSCTQRLPRSNTTQES
jgi:hypothetical protein